MDLGNGFPQSGTPAPTLPWRQAVEALAQALKACDPSTYHHGARVGRLASRLGRRLGMPPGRCDLLGASGLLHDIGKIGIPISLLCKPSPLTEEEQTRMRTHPVMGGAITDPLGGLGLAEVARFHHERWDGQGYPSGLSGKAIPEEARIVGLADAFDTLTSHRAYHRGIAPDEALAELKFARGTQFCPECVEALLALPEAELFPKPGLS